MTRNFPTAIILLLFVYPTADAGPINYGDFSGTSVMYIDVTETANTPEDEEPLYGSPTLFGDKLDFNPSGFAASGTGGSVDLTDGQLNFTLMGLPDIAITSFSIMERGDYTLFGTGTAATQIFYGLAVASVTVLEVDGVPLGSPVSLAAASASGGDNLSNGVDISTLWNLAINYDVNAALADAEVEFEFGATKLQIAINNTLGAISETASIAFIAKKDFMVNTETEMFPEPTTALLALLGLMGISLGRGFEKKHFQDAS
jgi:hypothetical protein